MASLRALECLVAVSDTGSITAAASLLHSSQPAISHQLTALEREAGTALLRREPRGVKLTPAGRAALTDARRAVDAAAAAVRAARAVGEGAGGSLRLACAQSLVAVLAPVLHAWHRRHPEVVITLHESTSAAELHDLIDADTVELVFMPGAVPDRFVGTVVAEEEIVLVAPSDHVLAQRASIRLNDLEGACLVHYAPENGLSTWLDLALTKAGVRVEPIMRTAVTATAPQLAAAGLGVAVCPMSAISDGFAGVVRSFAPRWTRQLKVLTAGAPDPLAARFIADLSRQGVPVPAGVGAQLSAGEEVSSSY
jgi:DNA-binding transcriptional LysR family regulator